MPRPRTPGLATVALLAGLYAMLLGLCLLLMAVLPRLPLQPIDPGRLPLTRPSLAVLGLLFLVAGAWLAPTGWLAVRRLGARRPRYVSWRYGLRSGAAFAVTWLVADVLIASGGPVHALLVAAVFLAAFPALAGLAQLVWPNIRNTPSLPSPQGGGREER